MIDNKQIIIDSGMAYNVLDLAKVYSSMADYVRVTNRESCGWAFGCVFWNKVNMN
ncbi:hypothetical protein LCGC14_3126630 [marine sediment metagenome]|uniref:Uncharacterized protein n=1 Tax=marine sediment metagenome TaxID=412755 RepID=A0A0F8W0Y2_9ZZZZ